MYNLLSYSLYIASFIVSYLPKCALLGLSEESSRILTIRWYKSQDLFTPKGVKYYYMIIIFQKHIYSSIHVHQCSCYDKSLLIVIPWSSSTSVSTLFLCKMKSEIILINLIIITNAGDSGSTRGGARGRGKCPLKFCLAPPTCCEIKTRKNHGPTFCEIMKNVHFPVQSGKNR